VKSPVSDSQKKRRSTIEGKIKMDDDIKKRKDCDIKRKAELDRNLIALSRLMFWSVFTMMLITNLVLYLHIKL
jgi:hypothetical protein